MRRLQLVLLLVGVALFIVLIRRVGLGAILSGLESLGWSFLGIFLIELAIDALHTEGWRWCLPPEARLGPRFHLLAARTAGVALNILTPTAGVSGEVMKGLLLRRWVPLADGFASVMVDKLTFAIAQAIFLLFGLYSLLARLPFDTREREVAVVLVTLWTAGVVAFFALQRAGLFRLGLGAVRALFGGSAFLDRLPGHAAEFDRRVSSLLTTHHRAIALSVLYHLLAHASRTLQFYLALSALGVDPDLAVCFMTAGGLVFMESTLFLVPGKLGVFEGGHVLIFTALGYEASLGLTVSFAMRLSELASALLGLVALAYYHLDSQASGKQGPPEEFPAAPVGSDSARQRWKSNPLA
jgi:uncharacterized protein (TIRG00374 family)